MALSTRWRIHAVLPGSVANGPGRRLVIWSQGCTLGCPGCFNPDTHDAAGSGSSRTVGELVDAVLDEAAGIEGVTLTGGEPLQQPAAVGAFCRELKARSRGFMAGGGQQRTGGGQQGAGGGLGIIVLTGYSRREIEADPSRSAAVRAADLVIAGRYQAARRIGSGLRGSANKTYWSITNRYAAADLDAVPEVELLVQPDGALVVTGLPTAAVVA